MKKGLVWGIAGICFVILVAVCLLLLREPSPVHGKLIVNGTEITEKNVFLYSDCTQLPLTAVLKGLGMSVNWFDENRAEVAYKNKKYTLNLSEFSLIENETNENVLLAPPGGKPIYKTLEKELILDDNTTKSVLFLMKIDVSIQVDRNTNTVYITEKEG